MRSKLIKTKFYMYWNLPLCFDRAPSLYNKKDKSFYGWVFPLGEWGLGSESPIGWNWVDTKLINNSEHVLERNIFA